MTYHGELGDNAMNKLGWGASLAGALVGEGGSEERGGGNGGGGGGGVWGGDEGESANWGGVSLILVV